MVQKKRYDREFKLEAARLVVEHSYTLLYKGFATNNWSIRQWILQIRKVKMA